MTASEERQTDSSRPMFALLARSGMATVTRLSGAALTLIAQILVARLLGPEGLGLYFIAISATAVASVVGSLGFPGTAARFVARYRTRGRRALGASFARMTQRAVAAVSSLLAIAGAMAALAAFERPLAMALALAALAVPALSLLRLNGALALAARRPWLFYIPDMIGRPLALVAMLAAVYWAGHPVGLLEVLLMSIVAAMSAAAVQMHQVGQAFHSGPHPVHASTRLRRLWWLASIPFLPAALLLVLFADVNVLLLSALLEPAEIAVYGVALKLAFLAGFGIQACQQLMLPDMADAVARGDVARLRRAARRTLLVSGLVAVLALIALAGAGPLVLALFGPHFQAGYGAMLILVAAQMFRIPEAIAVQFLTVSGHGVRVLVNLGMTMLVLAASSVLLVPGWGASGAAWAVLVALLSSSCIFVATALPVYRRMAGARKRDPQGPQLAPQRGFPLT